MNQQHLAVLIDADNSQPSIIEGLLDEIAQYGVASVKRIYGDWTSTQLKGWKPHLLEHGIQPIQQFGYTTGKNATDSAMIIDAMDLLYTGKFDGFCIVSSDSDFTRLASRIRESGVSVYGFGERKTPKPFVSACDKFVYTENLRKDRIAKAQIDVTKEQKLIALLRDAVDDAADYSGWANMGMIGQIVANKQPDFDPRSYGFTKLGELIRATGAFEFKDDDPLSNTRGIFVHNKRQKRRYN
ncbi:NYN domain-containing protein [Sulfurimonas sp. HSL-1656]|uniref:NYN domain-containing protein n=1 Tax=Thiomicrolovo subterrani TaxID=3131934 RepID=UPI0031F886DE